MCVCFGAFLDCTWSLPEASGSSSICSASSSRGSHLGRLPSVGTSSSLPCRPCWVLPLLGGSSLAASGSSPSTPGPISSAVTGFFTCEPLLYGLSFFFSFFCCGLILFFFFLVEFQVHLLVNHRHLHHHRILPCPPLLLLLCLSLCLCYVFRKEVTLSLPVLAMFRFGKRRLALDSPTHSDDTPSFDLSLASTPSGTLPPDCCCRMTRALV